MTTYKYVAMSPDGAKVTGIVNAVDEFTAVEMIKAKCPVILEVKEVKEKKSILDIEIGPKYDAKALSIMCNQFAIVLSSGVTVDNCLTMIAQQTKDKKLKKMLLASAEDVSLGTSIAIAFEKNYPGLPVTFLETIRAGEQSGTLDASFLSLASFYEKSYGFNQKVKSAMSYPLFVMGVAVVVLIVIMSFVMPTFISMFTELGGELPGITKALVAMTNFFQRYWLAIIAVIILIIVGFKLYQRNEEGKRKIAQIGLKLPVFGNLNSLQAATEFSSNMATLLGAGLTVSDALEVTSKVMTNYAISEEVRNMSENIKTGAELGTIIRKSEYFPDVLKEMTAVGEKTGEMEKTLQTISTYYSSEYNYAVSKAISKLEPAMLVFLAGFAGFIVIVLYMPMFTMYGMM